MSFFASLFQAPGEFLKRLRQSANLPAFLLFQCRHKGFADRILVVRQPLGPLDEDLRIAEFTGKPEKSPRLSVKIVPRVVGIDAAHAAREGAAAAQGHAEIVDRFRIRARAGPRVEIHDTARPRGEAHAADLIF
ncbi:MAG: hypothetical protein M5R36_03320 [Deltaproteobacteria bacterium]|nr:hypothetical protein [Deltaproteobacteria bacterium]